MGADVEEGIIVGTGVDVRAGGAGVGLEVASIGGLAVERTD